MPFFVMGLASKSSEMFLTTFVMLLLLSLDIPKILCIGLQSYGELDLMYEWTSLDFNWSSMEERREMIQNGSFIKDRNLIAGIKVYKDQIYLSIPRWRWNSGQPATLVKVVHTEDGNTRLSPYPSWNSQVVGLCAALQYVQSMEIDPNTGLMYVIDTGRTGIAGISQPENRCPAKLVIINLVTDVIVDVYELSSNIVSWTGNFMNDLVLDYVQGAAKFVYITDPFLGKLYVVDLDNRDVFGVEHDSMKPEPGNGTIIRNDGKDYEFKVGIDGIALSHDFDFVYYSSLGGYNLYRIRTSTLRNLANSPVLKPDDVSLVSRKVSQSDGLACSDKNRLYFGALNSNALYYLDLETISDSQKQRRRNHAELTTIQALSRIGNSNSSSNDNLLQHLVVRDDSKMQWLDTFAFDEKGYLWFVCNRLHLFNAGKMDFSRADNGGDGNMRVIRVFVNESSYLHDAPRRTKTLAADDHSNNALKSVNMSSLCYNYIILIGINLFISCSILV